MQSPQQSGQHAWGGAAVKDWETPEDQRDLIPGLRLRDLVLGALPSFLAPVGSAPRVR